MSDLILQLSTVNGEHAATVEVLAGTHIERASQQATRVATILGVVVRFDFNGVQCYARPGSDWQTLASRWQEIFSIPENDRPRHAMAWSAIPTTPGE